VRSGFREIDRLRRDRFLIANMPANMHRRITRVKLGRNLQKSGFMEIQLPFDVVRQAAVTVRQTRDITRECAL
jgi:hypothetical protein